MKRRKLFLQSAEREGFVKRVNLLWRASFYGFIGIAVFLGYVVEASDATMMAFILLSTAYIMACMVWITLRIKRLGMSNDEFMLQLRPKKFWMGFWIMAVVVGGIHTASQLLEFFRISA